MSDDEGLVDRLDASDWFGVCDDGRGGVRAVSYHKSKANAPDSTLQIFTLFEVVVTFSKQLRFSTPVSVNTDV